MKKTKKLFAGIALAAMLLTTGCNSSSNNNNPGTFRQQDVYQLYKAAGGDMSYEEWLSSVRGADGSTFYADGVDPNDAAGKEGDVFVNIASWDFFLKINGSWHKLGNLKGAQGDQGPEGPQGPIGPQGPQGEPGSQIYADGANPADSAGKEGDVFFNIETWDVFMKINNAWKKIGNIRGNDGVDGLNGADGSNIYADAVDPSAEGGKEGDIFFNISSWDVFMKINGVWSKIGNIRGKDGADGKDGKDGIDGKNGADGKDGADGADGASMLYGYGKPADSFGNDGDTYLDYNSLDIFGKQNGHWFRLNNLRADLTWDLDVQAEMNKYLCEVLPFADLNPDTMYHRFTTDYEYYYGFDAYIIGDDNDYNVLSDYGDKLIAAGFEYNPAGADFYGDYIKTTSRGYKIEVSFDYYPASDTTPAGNEIMVFMPPWSEPYSAEYFLDNDYVLVNGWPEANVNKTTDPLVFEGFNNDGVFYERFGKYNATSYGYYYDFVACEGSFGDEIAEQAEELGYEWNATYECYVDDDNREVDIFEQDGWTLVKFFGADVEPDDYSEAEFLANGFTKSEGWPADIIELAYNEEHRYGPVQENADWFYKVTTTEYTSGSHIGTKKTSGTLATEGDHTEEFIAAVEAAGFEYVASYGDYELPEDDMCYMYIKFQRGYTYVTFYGEYVSTGEVLDLPDPAEVNDKIIDWFSNKGVSDVPVCEYSVANANAYYEMSGAIIKVYNSTDAEKNAFLASLEELDWTITDGRYSGDYKAYYKDSTATLYVENWYSYIKIECAIEEPPAPPTQYSAAEASELMSLFFYANYDIEIEMSDYPFYDDESYFLWEEDYLEENDAMVLDGYGTDQFELEEFVFDMEELGWVSEFSPAEGTSAAYYKLSYLDTGATIQVIDFTEDYDVVRLAGFYVAPPMESFPNAQVNAFLTAYDLGFSISDEVAATMPGSVFEIGSGTSYGYAYVYVTVEGDYEAEYLAILEPILLAAGYELKSGSSGDYYANADDHQVSVRYYEDEGLTQILFFE